MKITQEVKAFAIEQAGRRCECTGDDCRHHLSGARCKRGLRDDDWKVYWRSEDGGLTRENISAWCLTCFENNYEPPRHSVALLAAEIVGYARLLDEDHRRAITLKSVLRDAAARSASAHRGRLVYERFDDDIVAELSDSGLALDVSHEIGATFAELASRLDLDPPVLHAGIHYGDVTRWRNGLIVGEAIDLVAEARDLAEPGCVALTGQAVDALRRRKKEVSPVPEERVAPLQLLDSAWQTKL